MITLGLEPSTFNTTSIYWQTDGKANIMTESVNVGISDRWHAVYTVVEVQSSNLYYQVAFYFRIRVERICIHCQFNCAGYLTTLRETVCNNDPGINNKVANTHTYVVCSRGEQFFLIQSCSPSIEKVGADCLFFASRCMNWRTLLSQYCIAGAKNFTTCWCGGCKVLCDATCALL